MPAAASGTCSRWVSLAVLLHVLVCSLGPAPGRADEPAQASPAAPTEPSAAVQASYYPVVEAAIREFEAGRFGEARALFLRAHELWPSARTLRTLGMTAFELRMYGRAVEELQAALDDPRRPLTDVQRAEVASLIVQARAFVGRFHVRLSPEDATLLVDGMPHVDRARPLLLAIGEHVLRVHAPGHGELRRTLIVEGREDEPLTLTLEPLATPSGVGGVLPLASDAPAPGGRPERSERDPRRLRPAALVALGVGAAGFLVSAVFTGLTLAERSELSAQCPERACPPRHHAHADRVKRFAHAATGGLAAGGLGTAAFVYLWVKERPRRAASSRLALRVGLDALELVSTF